MRPTLHHVLALVALTGCASNDALTTASEGQAGVPQSMSLTTDASVYHPGTQATFTLTGAAPNAFVGMFWTDAGPGTGPCPPLLDGACLDVLPPSPNGGFYHLPRADASGTLQATATVPSIDHGDYTFQAVAYDPATGAIVGSAPHTVSHQAAAIVPCTPDDGYEPNNGPADGDVFLPPSPTTGLTTCDGSPMDYFAVDLVAGELFNAAISFDIANGDNDLFMFNAMVVPNNWSDVFNASLAASIRSDGHEGFTFRAPDTARYYLGVYNFENDGISGTSSYELTWYTGATDCPNDDILEDNDFPTLTALISGGDYPDLMVCTDDGTDIYTFSLEAGELVQVTADWDEAADTDDDLDLYLFDEAGTRLRAEEWGVGMEALAYGTHDAATLTLVAKAYATGADDALAYDMSIDITPAPTACVGQEASEATNDERATAVTTTFPVSGWVCLVDASDFFAIDALMGDTLSVLLQAAQTAHDDLDLYVYDAAGTVVASSVQTYADETIDYVATADGPFVIEVRGFDLVSDGAYSLQATVTPAP